MSPEELRKAGLPLLAVNQADYERQIWESAKGCLPPGRVVESTPKIAKLSSLMRDIEESFPLDLRAMSRDEFWGGVDIQPHPGVDNQGDAQVVEDEPKTAAEAIGRCPHPTSHLLFREHMEKQRQAKEAFFKALRDGGVKVEDAPALPAPGVKDA